MNPAKERIKQFIESKGVSYRKFYDEAGLSNAFLSNNSAAGSDNLEKISSKFPELNIDWVVTGRGEMLLQDVGGMMVKEPETPYGITAEAIINMEVNDSDKIQLLKDRIMMLERDLAFNKEMLATQLELIRALRERLAAAGQDL